MSSTEAKSEQGRGQTRLYSSLVTLPFVEAPTLSPPQDSRRRGERIKSRLGTGARGVVVHSCCGSFNFSLLELVLHSILSFSSFAPAP